MTPYWQSDDGRHLVYCGDCRDVLPQLGKVDAVVTDPPYGVDFQGKRAKHTKNRHDNVYVDSEDYFREVVLAACITAIGQADCAAIFTGTRQLQAYPHAADIGGIICSNGAGLGPWGFSCYHPVLFYGRSPYLRAGKGSRPTATVINQPGMHVTGESLGESHPCQKPLAFMEWAVNSASLNDFLVLDPFAGSGTTAVACARLGRRSISIELEQRYCDIIIRRLEDELAQPFLIPPVPAKQEALFV